MWRFLQITHLDSVYFLDQLFWFLNNESTYEMPIEVKIVNNPKWLIETRRLSAMQKEQDIYFST